MSKKITGRILFDQWVRENLGLEDKVNAVRDAFYKQFETAVAYQAELPSWDYVWITEPIEDDFVVAQIGEPDQLFRISYEIDDDGNVTFGEPERGEMTFSATEHRLRHAARNRPAVLPTSKTERVLISESLRIVENDDGDPEGKKWLVRIIQAGLSMNKNYYPADVLAAAETIAIFEGVRVYDNHLTDEEWVEKRGHRAVNSEYMGFITEVYFADEALYGHFTVADIILREKMRTVWEADRKDEFGFSIDAGVEAEMREMNGTQVRYVTRFLDRDSVDVVFDPSAGGRMERLLEQRGGNAMKITLEEMKKALNGLSEDERKAFLEQFALPAAAAPAAGEPAPAPAAGDLTPAPAAVAPTPAPAVGEPVPAPVAVEPTPAPEADDLTPAPAAVAPAPAPAVGDMQAVMMAKAQESLDAVDLKLYQVDLKEALADSKLPKTARDFIYEQFSGRVFPATDVTRAIETQRGILATATESGRVKGMGGIRLSAGPVLEVSSFEFALQRMLGCLDEADKDKAPKGLRGLREWYQVLTADDEFKGTVARHRVAEANVTTSTVTSIVLDVLNKRALAMYESVVAQRWWEPLVTDYDEETIHDVYVYQTYGIGELPTVLEGDPYTEANWGDYEETASFLKKGKFIGVTLESFMKDNLNQLRRIPLALNRAWFYTLQAAVSYLFTQNSGEGATLGTTSRNWFNSTEANLGSGSAYALAYETFDAAQTAIFNMTEVGSDEPLGLLGKYLVVSSANMGLAEQIKISEKDPDNANNPDNIWRNRFEVVTVPKWNTNTARWYVLAAPADAPLIGLHWYRGQRAPSLFQAESELTGSMFSNDVMRFKTRSWFAISLADHIGAYGAVL